MSLMANAAMAPINASMPRRLARADDTENSNGRRRGGPRLMRRLARTRAGRRGCAANDRCARCEWNGGSAARDAHVPRHRGRVPAPIDDEVVALRLAQDRRIDRRIEEIVALRGA